MRYLVSFAILSFFFISILFFYYKNDVYSLKIEMQVDGLSSKYIDENISNNITKELLKYPKIKEIVSFSSFGELNLYCKIYPNILIKENIINNVKSRLALILKGYDEVIKVNIDDKYNIKYDYFLIIENLDYFELKKMADKLLNEILQKRTLEKIKVFGERKIVNYIYFSNKNLQNLDLDILEIKDIVKNINQKNNFINFENQQETINGSIASIEDISKIGLHFKDKNFSTNFLNTFEIKKSLFQNEPNQVFCGGKYAIVFALAKKKHYPNFLFWLELQKIKKQAGIKIKKINKFQKIQIYLDRYSDIATMLEFYKNMNENLKNDNIYFLNTDLPMGNNFTEQIPNRITIFTEKADKNKLLNFLLKNNIDFVSSSFRCKKMTSETLKELEDKLKKNSNYINLGTRTKNIISHKILNDKLNDYFLSKNEVISALNACVDGFFLGSYYVNEDKIDILLKNIDDGRYFYSKKTKSIIDSSVILESNLIKEYQVIARKNMKYFTLLQFKTLLKY